MSNIPKPHTIEYRRRFARFGELAASQYALQHARELMAENPEPTPPPAPTVTHDPRVAHRALILDAAYRRYETEDADLALACSREKTEVGGGLGDRPLASRVQALTTAQAQIDARYRQLRADLKTRMGNDLAEALRVGGLDDESMSKPYTPPQPAPAQPGSGT